MKILGYRVHQVGPRNLDGLLNLLQARPLPDRVFEGQASGVRLEDARPIGQYFMADFARARGGHGPGRMGRDSPLADIALEEGEYFGEDTGIAYDPVSRYVAIQYNHFGPRAAAIETYLQAADVSFGGLRAPAPGQGQEALAGYRIGAVLRPDAQNRLRRLGIYREIAFTVSVPGLRAADREIGRSLSSVLENPLPDGVETVKVIIAAGARRGGGLGERGVMAYVNDIQRAGMLVTQAVVKGKPQAGEPTETVDLIDEVLSRKVDIPLGFGRRYARDDRWRALSATLEHWLGNGAFPQ